MSNIIVSASKALNRSIDVRTTVNKDQAEAATDLSVLVFATPDAPFRHGAERLRFYTDMDGIGLDFASSKEAYRAANAFFSQRLRPKTFAVGRIFEAAVAGYMKSKAVESTMATWTAVTAGVLDITIDGVLKHVTSLDFHSCADLDDVADVLNTALSTPGATCANENGAFLYTSKTTGSLSSVSAMTAVGSGVDVGGPGFLNAFDDPADPTDNLIVVPGYTPTANIADELSYIAEAASASGKFCYGWALDKTYRDSSDQTDVASWAEARRVCLGLTLNSPLVLDPNSTSDIGYLLGETGNIRSFTVYHDQAFYYPEVAIQAIMLSVNYASEKSTRTAKFANLIGIPTVGVNSTDMATLLAKRVNTFTAVGNTARTFREGQEASAAWFMDDLINLDNYEEELQTEVFNVFLQNPKVPYTEEGIALQRAAITKVSSRYVYNGTFAERPATLSPGENRVAIEPAYLITNAPLESMTTSDRAQRKGPPFTVKANLAGAIHSVDIAVNAYA